MKPLFRMLMALTILGAAPLAAQESTDWDWRVAPYLWGLNIDGTTAIGPIEQDMDTSFSDILSSMEFGGSIMVEAGKGAHGFHVDYTYLRLKPDANELRSPAFFAGSNISPKITANVLRPIRVTQRVIR